MAKSAQDIIDSYNHNNYGVNPYDSMVFFDWLDPGYKEVRDFEKNLALQHDAQSFNASEAEKVRQWETMMSNTAVQRNVADIKAAGLNPWLAIQGSGAIGASSPSSAPASSAMNSGTSSNNNGLAQIISSALAIVGKALNKVD